MIDGDGWDRGWGKENPCQDSNERNLQKFHSGSANGMSDDGIDTKDTFFRRLKSDPFVRGSLSPLTPGDAACR